MKELIIIIITIITILLKRRRRLSSRGDGVCLNLGCPQWFAKRTSAVAAPEVRFLFEAKTDHMIMVGDSMV